MNEDPLTLLGRNKLPASELLHNLLSGSSVFLLGGGPSVNLLPLSKLRRRGVWTMAINNAAGHPEVRPQAFICADPPEKFSHSIWLDPAIMKFVPVQKIGGRRGEIRRKVNGNLEYFEKMCHQCPNVWVFDRAEWMWPDDRFFESEQAQWGNLDLGVELTKQKKTVCTMLLAIRILRFLGAKRIFLLGVDFRMAPGYGYSFNQNRTDEDVQTNNEHFAVVTEWLGKMEKEGVFQRAGLEILNCNPDSALGVFPIIRFDRAMEQAAGEVEECPSLAGWYEK